MTEQSNHRQQRQGFVCTKSWKLLTTAIALFSLSLPIEGISQLQRLAFLPGQKIQVKKGNPAQTNTICIDYQREVPNELNSHGLYKHVYDTDFITVKINGVNSKLNLKSAIEGGNPLLILTPISYASVEVRINPDYKNYRNIQLVEFETNKLSSFGWDPADNDIARTEIIFNTWENRLTQKDFWNISKALDMLEINKKLDYRADKLEAKDKSLVERLVYEIDFDLFPGTIYQQLVINHVFCLDETGHLTEKSKWDIQNHFDYFLALNTSKMSNAIAFAQRAASYIAIEFGRKTASSFSSQKVPEELALALKVHYYGLQAHLPHLNEANESLRDTIINGQRHVLMLAWKTQEFVNNYVKANNVTPWKHESYNIYFEHATFVIPQYEMERFIKENNLRDLDPPAQKLRLTQVLGLPPSSSNDHFIELWIQPKDLFRPAIDPSTSGTRLPFPIDYAHFEALKKFTLDSYSNRELNRQFPFMASGETYDWSPANTSHRGLPEFVMINGQLAHVRSKNDTQSYIRRLISQ
jgi:hypothetical protein